MGSGAVWAPLPENEPLRFQFREAMRRWSSTSGSCSPNWIHRDQPCSNPERQILRARFPQQSPRRAPVKISVSELRMKFSAGSLQWTARRHPAVTSRPTKHKMVFSRVSSSGMRFVSSTNTQMTSRPSARLSIRISRETMPNTASYR